MSRERNTRAGAGAGAGTGTGRLTARSVLLSVLLGCRLGAGHTYLVDAGKFAVDDAAFYSEEGLEEMRVKGSENCRRVLLGQPPRNVVN